MNEMKDRIAEANRLAEPTHERRLDRLREELADRQVDTDRILTRLVDFAVAQPSWGLGTGGTRFARFPGAAEPAGISDKLADAALVQMLAGCCGAVSPHFPWDEVSDYTALREEAVQYGLAFDAVNSNTFQDRPGDTHSYKFGSLTHTDAAVRAQAVDHNIACIEAGRQLGSSALTVWIADGSNFPGQADFARAFDRYLDSMQAIDAALPDDWTVLIEHKLYEPAFYSTVVSDWGTSLLAAQALGDKAKCLIDLGHHAPTTNIEQIIARLDYADKLGGFHFNDSKYGDDDLDAGSIAPFQLFLIFNELVEAQARSDRPFAPAYMLDQSHNVTDPIESLAMSADALMNALAKALIVDRDGLRTAQEANDAIAARMALTDAFQIDTRPLVAEARRRKEAAIDPLAAYRQLNYRAGLNRAALTGSGGGIV